MAITLQKEGRRVYLLGNTYPVKDQIKSGGGKWDAEKKAWYLGVQRKALAEELAGQATAGLQQRAQAERENGISTSACVIKGRAQYEGKTYYILAIGTTAEGKQYAKLAFRDGSRVFWAKNADAVTVLRTYEEPTSIDSLRAYAERMKSAKEEFGGDGMCAECEERRAVTTASDSSGFIAGVCARCASMSPYERSYC
jgi:hypothetical protein